MQLGQWTVHCTKQHEKAKGQNKVSSTEKEMYKDASTKNFPTPNRGQYVAAYSEQMATRGHMTGSNTWLPTLDRGCAYKVLSLTGCQHRLPRQNRRQNNFTYLI